MVSGDQPGGGQTRRRIISSALWTALGLAGASLLTVTAALRPRSRSTPADEPPHPDDLLVHAAGAKQRHLISTGEVPVAGAQVLAWPMDARTATIKNGTPHNLILLVRAADPAWFSSQERTRTAGGVAAYSAVCTHLCCAVSDWVSGPAAANPHGFLLCPCHQSQFDPWDGARVVSGPAPRPLPALPLRRNTKGLLVIAGDFITPVGCMA